MIESHVSWMTILHCYIMWFHKSRGTNNTIHIWACFFTWGKARGVPDAVYHHTQSMNLNPTDVYHSIFYGSIITGGTFNMNTYFGHPENTTDSSVKRSKTKRKLCVHTTCVKKNVQWLWRVVTKFNKLISQFLWEKLCYQILMVSFYFPLRHKLHLEWVIRHIPYIHALFTNKHEAKKNSW